MTYSLHRFYFEVDMKDAINVLSGLDFAPKKLDGSDFGLSCNQLAVAVFHVQDSFMFKVV